MTSQNLSLINSLNKSIQSKNFKSSSFFTGSVINNIDTTQLIRDIQSQEIEFFKDKTPQQIDDEELEFAFDPNNINDTTRFELLKDPTVDMANILKLQPEDLVDLDADNVGQPEKDIEMLKKIHKRLSEFAKVYSIKQINFDEIVKAISQVQELQRLISAQQDELKKVNFVPVEPVEDGTHEAFIAREEAEIKQLEQELEQLEGSAD